MKAPALSTASTQHNPLSHFQELINIQLCLLVCIFISKVEVFTNFGHLLSQVNKSLILQRDICRKQKTAELTLLIPTCNLLCKEISRNTHTQCRYTFYKRHMCYAVASHYYKKLFCENSDVILPISKFVWVRGGILLNTCHLKKLWRGQED